ncbi:hypothetical protein ACIRON_18090 [Nocardioides sp. NPDC101246]|uniref:hypothetical protein n=1 Tax=Nocardioides sp. NPDC101246 TaxID=3364336 RepID=UPI0037FE98D8
MSSSVAQVMAEVRATDWSRFSIPAENHLWDYEASRVVPAFEQLLEVFDEETRQRAVWALLGALGHNHSGTPSLAMVRGGELLVEMFPYLDAWALDGVIEVLTDCYLFVAGVSDYRTADGAVHDLTVLQPVIASLRPKLSALATSGPVEVRSSAAELARTIDEVPWVTESRGSGQARSVLGASPGWGEDAR